MMKRRGPDSKNFYKRFYNSKQLALLHSRLNIIDLNERANQPYHDEDFIIVFNGEIYNYLEIKSKLENKNYKFKTNSDTEIILYAIKKWGLDQSVKKFGGGLL